MDFLNSFLVVAEKVGLLFLLIAVGFVCQRTRLMTEEANRCLADLVMYLVTPCVIIGAFTGTVYAQEELIGILRNIGLVALIAAVVHGGMIALVHLVFRFRDEDRRRIMRFAAVFSNTGYIALPLAQALIDTDGCREGSLYAAVYLAVFNILLWTYGLVTMSGERRLHPKKLFGNAGIIGVTVGMFFFTAPLWLGELRLPGLLCDGISAMSALNLPLPMLMVGYYLGKADLRAAFRDGWSYLCIALRLVIFPLASFGVMYLCGVRGNVLLVSVIGTAAPVGATTTIFAAKFGRDTALSVRLVSLSTILSMLTMPVIVGLTQMVA